MDAPNQQNDKPTARPSPCNTCKCVAYPRRCENKECQAWREWWIERWEQIRSCAQARLNMAPTETPARDKFQYDTPDHIRRYLQEKPCEKCQVPKDLCHGVCRSLRRWEEYRKEIDWWT